MAVGCLLLVPGDFFDECLLIFWMFFGYVDDFWVLLLIVFCLIFDLGKRIDLSFNYKLKRD